MNWPKITIELGGQPPSRTGYNRWFWLNWFPGDEHSRRQLSVYLPFFKLRICP